MKVGCINTFKGRGFQVKLKAVCGKEFKSDVVDEELSLYPEYICSRFCCETNCTIYTDYNYWASHNNDPK